MTHRQRAGLTVIALLLVLVAAITSQQIRLVTGTAQAVPVPKPPMVGDCVVNPVSDSGLMSANVTATSGGTVPVYPALQIRSCNAARYGEVVAVIATPKPTVAEGDGDDRYLDDPNMTFCSDAADHYVGMPKQLVEHYWRPGLQTSVAMSRPSPRQEAAGQHWAACIVAPQAPDLVTPARLTQQYGSSIRDAMRTGAQRDQLGSCTMTADGVVIVGGCQQPHTLEVLASGDSGDRPVSRPQLEASCRKLVDQLTAMADPTADGALSIRIDATRGIDDTNNKLGVVIATQQVPAHSNLACTIAATGTRKLRGSLIALGPSSIPWA